MYASICGHDLAMGPHKYYVKLSGGRTRVRRENSTVTDEPGVTESIASFAVSPSRYVDRKSELLPWFDRRSNQEQSEVSFALLFLLSLSLAESSLPHQSILKLTIEEHVTDRSRISQEDEGCLEGSIARSAWP